jgi:anthranilate phosphoribosyltransferase
MQALGHTPLSQARLIQAGEQAFVPTEVLSAGLKKLLDVRRFMGLRNAAHSLVKLFNPVDAPALVVGSYTHPYYIDNMLNAWELTQGQGLLLRGTEGEVVADARRRPQMQALVHGQRHLLCEAQSGSLKSLPELPTNIDAPTTAAYIRAVVQGQIATPEPIKAQVEAIIKALQLYSAGSTT